MEWATSGTGCELQIWLVKTWIQKGHCAMRARVGKKPSHWTGSWATGGFIRSSSSLLHRSMSSKMLSKCEQCIQLPCFSLADVICAVSAGCNLGVKCFIFCASGNMRSKAIWNLAQRIHSVTKKNRSLFIWNRHITMTMWRQRQRCRSSLTMQRGSLSLSGGTSHLASEHVDV